MFFIFLIIVFINCSMVFTIFWVHKSNKRKVDEVIKKYNFENNKAINIGYLILLNCVSIPITFAFLLLFFLMFGIWNIQDILNNVSYGIYLVITIYSFTVTSIYVLWIICSFIYLLIKSKKIIVNKTLFLSSIIFLEDVYLKLKSYAYDGDSFYKEYSRSTSISRRWFSISYFQEERHNKFINSKLLLLKKLLNKEKLNFFIKFRIAFITTRLFSIYWRFLGNGFTYDNSVNGNESFGWSSDLEYQTSPILLVSKSTNQLANSPTTFECVINLLKSLEYYQSSNPSNSTR